MMKQNTFSNKGQAFTLEGVVASMLVISVALIFSLQITAITPLSASTSSQHIENQQAELAQGTLETASRDELAQMLLYWNESAGKFYNSDPDGVYRVEPPNIEFPQRYNSILIEKGIGVNIKLTYYNNATTYSDTNTQYFSSGQASDHAYTVERTVPIYEDDPIYDSSGTPSAQNVTQTNFYLDNVYEGSELYNTVTIKFTVWRI